MTENITKNKTTQWSSPLSEERWKGYRSQLRGVAAFKSLYDFEKAQVLELDGCLSDHEKETLGRLLSRGNKSEMEIFIRGHGANPIFPPQEPLGFDVGVAKADVVNLNDPVSEEAANAILDGDIVHVLFQAGEGSRFKQGPFYSLNPLKAAQDFKSPENTEALKKIEHAKAGLPDNVAQLILDESFGPKQPLLIRAALRRVVMNEVNAGRLKFENAVSTYKEALARQKILFLISEKPEVSDVHNKNLRERFHFYGFKPDHLVTIEQQLVHGLTVNEKGEVSLLNEPWALDAAGHLYVLLQAARPEDFTSYMDSGRPIKSREVDGLGYLANKGRKIINVVRINDMDRHSTEIINPKAITYALKKFSEGYKNVIEGVSNTQGQKGGTGTTFVDPNIHVLTETHENSFPALSRPFEEAMVAYLKSNQGRHPAYNAMRQLADLSTTRQVLREYGARIVFVPRQKEVDGKTQTYLGVDMPMGDLSLLFGKYKSRMFQFAGPDNKELLIHDMKKQENLPMAVATIERQLVDPYVIAAMKEAISGEIQPFTPEEKTTFTYGAPTPEFN